MLILGILLFAAAVYLIFFARKKANEDLLEIQFQQTKSVEEVRESLESMADIDSNYRELVEIKGSSYCKNPPTAPFSQKKTAFYVADTYQVSEETVRERDEHGGTRTRAIKHEDILCEEESSEPLYVKDDNGKMVMIETNGVSDKLDLLKTLDRFEPANGGYAGYHANSSMRFREFTISNNGYRLLGYKQVEKTFPLGAKMYVLGEAYMQSGEIIIGPPRDSDKPFIVSTKSEEELVKNKKKSATISLVIGIACAIFGIICVVGSII